MKGGANRYTDFFFIFHKHSFMNINQFYVVSNYTIQTIKKNCFCDLFSNGWYFSCWKNNISLKNEVNWNGKIIEYPFNVQLSFITLNFKLVLYNCWNNWIHSCLLETLLNFPNSVVCVMQYSSQAIITICISSRTHIILSSSNSCTSVWKKVQRTSSRWFIYQMQQLQHYYY